MLLTVALFCVLNALSALGQLSGRVGPTTSRSAKQATTCNVLNYGGTVGSSVRPFHSYSVEQSTYNLPVIGHWTRHSVRVQQLCSQEQGVYSTYPCR